MTPIINFDDEILVADIMKILPKNTIIVHNSFYNETTGRSGAMATSIMKNRAFMESEVVQIRPIMYTKNKLAIHIILKSDTQ